MKPADSETLRAALATREALMRYHDPERIQGYCRTCEKYGRFWSCPPFEEAPLRRFSAWERVVVVCQKTVLEPGTTMETLTARFLEARHRFVRRMLRLEGLRPGATALVAGHCSGCARCTRLEKKPCRTPEKLRYSLEAVGFDVTGLALGLAGQKVHWPKEGPPEYLLTVGALLCPTSEDGAALLRAAGEK